MLREHVREDWRERLSAVGVEAAGMLLEDAPDRLPIDGSWQLLSKPGLSGRQRWRWTIEDSSAERRIVYVKRYDAPPLRQQWDRLRRQAASHSTAWWEFQQANRLAALRVPAAAAIGYAERMCGPIESRSAVLLEGVSGEAFDRFWTAACERGERLTHGMARHDITRRLARFVAAFHQTGFRHRDLYLCHIFIDAEHAEAPPQFRLIDLARTFRPRWRRMRWLIKDLSQLDVSARQIGASRADRLRFLLTYLGLQRGTARAGRIINRIEAKSDRILGRMARKGG